VKVADPPVQTVWLSGLTEHDRAGLTVKVPEQLVVQRGPDDGMKASITVTV